MNQELNISWKQNLICIWISQILCMAGFSLIYPFVPIFFRDVYHMNDQAVLGLWVAILTFCGMFSFGAAAPLWGALADRFGRKLMLLRSYYVTGLLFPLLYFAPNVYWFVAIRFVVSAFSGTVTASQTLVVTTTPSEHHGFALGALSTAFWSGNLIGFIIGGLSINLFGFFWSFMICGILYLVAGILVHIMVKENFEGTMSQPSAKTAPKKKKRWDMILHWAPTIRCIMFIFLLMGMARRFDEPFLAIMVETIGGKENTALYTGLICAGAAFGGIISGFVIGKLCDRLEPQKVAIPMVILGAVTMVVQAFAEQLWLLAVARFITFFCAGGLEPAFQTMLARNAAKEEQGALFGWSSSARMTGIIIAAAIGGVMIYYTGIRGVFVTAAVLMLLLLPLLLVLNIIERRSYQFSGCECVSNQKRVI
ncbi:MAG: MFS transporter [Victivallaceae bacterium]|nr:MFS transporter [Victivallaceae bacterium]